MMIEYSFKTFISISEFLVLKITAERLPNVCSLQGKGNIKPPHTPQQGGEGSGFPGRVGICKWAALAPLKGEGDGEAEMEPI